MPPAPIISRGAYANCGEFIARFMLISTRSFMLVHRYHLFRLLALAAWVSLCWWKNTVCGLAASTPGEYFWLNARGDVDDQIETFAINLGLPIEDLKPAEVRAVFLGKLRKSELPFLWIVDDIEESIGEEAFRSWLLPDMALARTIITTRSREFEGPGSQLVLDQLSPDEAFDLLTRKVQPESSQEIAAAEGISLDLG